MLSTHPETEHRAAPAQLPDRSPAFQRERQTFARYCLDREAIERRSVVRSLLLTAVLVLLGSLAHAGLYRVFVHGWWRP